MADACVQAGAHYIDITGEIPVFERLAARDGEARARGIMLLPGAGFDVVPPTAWRCTSPSVCQGAPSWCSLSRPPAASHEGRQARSSSTWGPAPSSGAMANCDACRSVTAPGWSISGAVSGSVAAHPGAISRPPGAHGIPNITVYRATSPAELRLMPVLRAGSPVARDRPVQRLLRTWVRRRLRGPDADARRAGFSRFYGEVGRPDGAVAAARLRAPEASR